MTCAFAQKPIRPLRSQKFAPRWQRRSATNADIIHAVDDVPFSGIEGVSDTNRDPPSRPAKGTREHPVIPLCAS